jgi:adenine-specific DNA-methyltransferase
MDEVNACIAANAEPEELVDKPQIVSGVIRVTGPFTVEGVRPEELSLGDQGLFDYTPNEFETDESDASGEASERNVQAYLAQMLQHLRSDGVTFLGNQGRKFGRLDALFEDASGSLIHAEGTWEGTDTGGPNTVAVSFGPQAGPVTALQVEEAIRVAKRYDELVIAGFSFDAEAYASVEEQTHPKLRIHIAQIRPDLNDAMKGLLKDTPNSQLFTVFGQPEVALKETNAGWVCTLKGVDIYNPVENTVRSSGAEKVAAWFLDSDFDGRCFCITQAFFPDQDAWERIANALGSSADSQAFDALKGTLSVPFPKGKYGRVAVKVIDPRGNEVMAVRKLE